MMVDTAELVGVSEIAEHFDVAPGTVGNWAKRHADFPAPVWESGRGRLWLLPQVTRWHRLFGPRASNAALRAANAALRANIDEDMNR